MISFSNCKSCAHIKVCMNKNEYDAFVNRINEESNLSIYDLYGLQRTSLPKFVDVQYVCSDYLLIR